jgi:hypothetical protein
MLLDHGNLSQGVIAFFNLYLATAFHHGCKFLAFEMLHSSAGPADFNRVNTVDFAETEVKRKHHLRRITGTRFNLPHHRFSACGEPHARPDRIAIARSPYQLQFNRVANLLQVVQVEHRRLIVAVHDQIQPAIIVKVGDRNAAPIFHAVRTGRPRNVYELPATDIRKQAFVLVTVPGVITDKLVAEKEPLLIFVNVRDRARCER